MADLEVEMLRTRARKGDLDAQFDLALRYSDGLGVPESASTAFRWLERAAGEGHVEAMAALGRCYHGGLGVDMDEDAALQLVRTCIRAPGSDDVHLDLGQLLSAADSQVRDVARAVQILEEGWEQPLRTRRAPGSSGSSSRRSWGTTRRRCDWLRLAADGGDTSAMVTLGYRHRFGEGVPQDLPEMLRWYRAAAAEEDPTAIANLAICYQNGEGVREDEVPCLRACVSEAASLGHTVDPRSGWPSRWWTGRAASPDAEAGRVSCSSSWPRPTARWRTTSPIRLLDGPGLEQDQEAGLKWMRKRRRARPRVGHHVPGRAVLVRQVRGGGPGARHGVLPPGHGVRRPVRGRERGLRDHGGRRAWSGTWSAG